MCQKPLKNKIGKFQGIVIIDYFFELIREKARVGFKIFKILSRWAANRFCE